MRQSPDDSRSNGGRASNRRPNFRNDVGLDGSHYPLPRATAQALVGDARCENPSLTLNRLVGPWTAGPGGWQPPEGEKRKEFLRKVAQTLRRDLPACRLLADALARQKAALTEYAERGQYVRTFSRSTAWRLVTGLGGVNPLEISLTLHRIHGYPFIPASGLKGAMLAYARSTEAIEAGAIAEVFGTLGRVGGATFFDALPELPPPGESLLDIDLINPHFGPYYQRDEPPADYWSPKPVFFLAIQPGTHFHFAIAARTERIAGLAANWLGRTLSESGVGGKTAAGYGAFEEAR